MKKIILSLLLFLFIFRIDAYENEYFKINIDSSYKEEILDNNTYKWTKDNNYIAVTIDSNQSKKYDVSKFTDEDIQKQKEYLENSFNETFEEYNIKVDVTDIGKVNLNDNVILRYSLYYPTKDLTGSDTYQIGHVYTTNSYIFTLIYSSDKNINLNNDLEYNDIINSFETKDKIKTVVDRKSYLRFILVLGVILGILGYLLSLKKHKK